MIIYFSILFFLDTAYHGWILWEKGLMDPHSGSKEVQGGVENN